MNRTSGCGPGSGFPVSKGTFVFFKEHSLSPDYHATELRFQALDVFFGRGDSAAVVLFMRGGAERFALVDLMSHEILNDRSLSAWIRGPTGRVILAPDGLFTALLMPISGYSKKDGVFELKSDKYVVISDHAFNANATDNWLAESLTIHAGGETTIQFMRLLLDEDGQPSSHDAEPIEMRSFNPQAISAKTPYP